jgi:hypothetical protein
MLCSLREFVAETGKFGRCCRVAPSSRETRGFDGLASQIVRDFGNGQNKIVRRVVLLEVDEVLQHGEGLML